MPGTLNDAASTSPGPPGPSTGSLTNVLDVITAADIRVWGMLTRAAFATRRREIDELNVFPVPDGDTGTNLYLTIDTALDEVFGKQSAAGTLGEVTLAQEVDAFATAMLLSARGNSGVILSQMVRGLRDVVVEGRLDVIDAEHAAEVCLRAAASARAAVATPVEGTILTVADVAGEEAIRAYEAGGNLLAVVTAAAAGARAALARTPDQMPQLAQAGVVDAGGAGYVLLLEALRRVVAGEWDASTERAITDGPDLRARGWGRAQTSMGPSADSESPQVAGSGAPSATSPGGQTPDQPQGAASSHEPAGSAREAHVRGCRDALDLAVHRVRGTAGGVGGVGGVGGEVDVGGGVGLGGAADVDEAMSGGGAAGAGPAFEVMYLLSDSDHARVEQLKGVLAPLGDSLLVVGGPDVWNVHVHVDDVGAAIEAGIEAGRPHRIVVTHFAEQIAARRARHAPAGATTAVVACAVGPGVEAILREAGAVTVPSAPGARASAGALLNAARSTGAPAIVFLPNDKDTVWAAEAAAAAAENEGLDAHVIPARTVVQGLAALAVYDPGVNLHRAVVDMTAAAVATRHGAVTIASKEALTSGGRCSPGDALGIVDGDIVIVGDDLGQTAREVLERLLSAGGELVSLVRGEEAEDALLDELAAYLHRAWPEVEVSVLDGGQPHYPLLVGVE